MYVRLSRSFGVLDIGQRRDAQCPGRGNGRAVAYDAAWAAFLFTTVSLGRNGARNPCMVQVAVTTNVLFD